MRFSTLFLNVLALTVFCLASGALLAVPPSESAKKELLTAVERLEKDAAEPLARYEKLKAEGKLEEVGNQRNCVDIGHQLRRPMLDAIDAFDAAVTGGGGHDPWPASDPDIAKARQTIDAMRAKLEAAGMFTMRMPGEPPTTIQDRVDNIHDAAWNAALDAKHGKIDDARASFKQLDSRVEGAKAEAGSADHPGFKRFLTAYAKHKADAETYFAKSDSERGGVDKEVADLTATYEKVQKWFQEVETRSGGGGTEEGIMASLSELATMTEAFETGDLPAVTKQMEAFAATYGKTQADIDQKITELQGRNDYNPSPGRAYAQLGEMIARAREIKTDRAAYLLQDVTQTINGLNSFAEDIQVKRMLVCKTKLELAARLDPANAQVKERLAGVDGEISSRSAFIEKEIDGRQWEGHAATFQGPGDADALAAEAAKYLKLNGWEDNPPRELLAVRIAGAWRGGDKNLLGEFINYQLPCEAAFRLNSDKAAGKDLARVYFISLYTQDKVYNPPFAKGGVGDNYYLRASKVTGGSAGSGSGAGAGPSGGWGLFSTLFWLALALVNIVAGLLAAESFLAGKLPPAAGLVKALAPLKGTIGLACIAVGGLAFLRALVLYFSPLADLLPQATAIAAGLLLARERMVATAAILTQQAQAAQAAQTAQESAQASTATPADASQTAPAKPPVTFDVAAAKLAALEPLSVPIGLACVVLGILHLVMGGFPLI